MDYQVIISGAGIPGLTLALLLEKAGIRTAVIDPDVPDQKDDFLKDGRTSALLETSLSILQNLIPLETLSDFSEELHEIRILDRTLDDGKKIAVSFSSSEIGQTRFGLNVSNRGLRNLLYQKAREAKNIVLKEDRLEGYTVSDFDVKARALSGETLGGKLIIGADGRNSSVRKIAGIISNKKSYKKQALTLVASHSKKHKNRSIEIHRNAGPLTFVPLPGERSSIVWVETDDKAEHFAAMRRQYLQNILQDLSEGVLGDLRIDGPIGHYPLICLKAASLSAPRTALIAEAAHVIHPLGAQGLNLSMRDVTALAGLITRYHLHGLDIGSHQMLKHYQRRRLPDIQSRTIAVDGMVSMISHTNPLLHTIRRNALQLMPYIPFAKKMIMKEGMAPSIVGKM